MPRSNHACGGAGEDGNGDGLVHLTLRPPSTSGRQHAIANNPSMDNGDAFARSSSCRVDLTLEADHGQRRVQRIMGARFTLRPSWSVHRIMRASSTLAPGQLGTSGHWMGDGTLVSMEVVTAECVMQTQHKRTSWHHLDYLGGLGRIRTRNLSSNCVWHSYGSSQRGEVGSVTLCFPSERPNQKRKVERVE